MCARIRETTIPTCPHGMTAWALNAQGQTHLATVHVRIVSVARSSGFARGGSSTMMSPPKGQAKRPKRSGRSLKNKSRSKPLLRGDPPHGASPQCGGRFPKGLLKSPKRSGLAQKSLLKSPRRSGEPSERLPKRPQRGSRLPKTASRSPSRLKRNLLFGV